MMGDIFHGTYEHYISSWVAKNENFVEGSHNGNRQGFQREGLSQGNPSTAAFCSGIPVRAGGPGGPPPFN